MRGKVAPPHIFARGSQIFAQMGKGPENKAILRPKAVRLTKM